MRDRSPPRGFSLVELVVALVLGTVVLGAAGQLYLVTRRFFRLQSSVLEVHEGLRAAMQVLLAEVRELDTSGGDIVAVGPDSISIRATRGVDFVCAPAGTSSGGIVVRNSISSGYRDVDPARDRALVFRDGDPGTEDDDAWLDRGIASAGGAADCADGAAGTQFRLVGTLDSVWAGAPVRWYERVVYRLYQDEGGAWWLGVRSFSDGGWAALSPVAGPLLHPAGLRFSYHDTAGAVTADPGRVATVAITLRGAGSAVLQGVGGTYGHWVDSLATVVSLRNGRR